MNPEMKKGGVMRAARRQRQMTQLALARQVGCTESLITKIETGRSMPEASLKQRIADVLGIHTWEVGV